jgi:hypothetical protein
MAHVGDHDGYLDYVGEAAAGVLEDAAEVGAARAGRAAGSLTTTLQPEVRS